QLFRETHLARLGARADRRARIARDASGIRDVGFGRGGRSRVKARENPFAAERVIATIRYACPGGDLDTLIARLATLGYRAAIVGPHGAGKTTLLEDLGRALEARGFRITTVRLATDDRRLPGAWPSRAARLGPRDIVCLDGAEQLSTV